ncbi:MAG: hypothetical protein GDA42_06885 [Ekhidna sp.]|nr:hypothetical protein [Ekhidna sp.]
MLPLPGVVTNYPFVPFRDRREKIIDWQTKMTTRRSHFFDPQPLCPISDKNACGMGKDEGTTAHIPVRLKDVFNKMDTSRQIPVNPTQPIYGYFKTEVKV